MRSPSLVLMICDDGDFAGLVRATIKDVGDVRLRVFATMPDAFARTAAALPGLVLVHLTERLTDAQVAYLLGKAALPRQAVPVVLIDDTYDADRALKFYQMGVTDYLSRADHLDRLAPLVDALVVRQPPRAADGLAGKRAPKRWKVSSPVG